MPINISYDEHLAQVSALQKQVKYVTDANEKLAADYGQISFFNEAEEERTALMPEPEIEEVVVEKHTRKKKRTYEEKYGSDMTFLKYENRKEIKIIPAQISVVEHKRAVYVCRESDKNGIESNFVSGKAIAPLIEKSLVSPSIMAYIMNQKFCNSMPLYR